MTRLFLIVLIITFNSCNSQNQRIEIKLQNCIYDSYPEYGVLLKKSIIEYENHLITKDVLKNKKGSSYKNLFTKINELNSRNLIVDYYFSKLLVKKPTSINPKLSECINSILTSKEYLTSKPHKLEKAINEHSEKKSLTASELTKSINSILNEDDYELDFYKLRIFMLIESNSQSFGLNNRINDSKLSETKPTDLSNSLNIVLNKNNKILIQNKTLTIDELNNEVRKYEIEFKNESIITIQASREAKYKDYASIQDAIKSTIDKLRQELSLKKFNKELDQLSDEDFKTVRATYPINVRNK